MQSGGFDHSRHAQHDHRRGQAVVPVSAPDKPSADSDLAAIRFRVGRLQIPVQPPRIHALAAGLPRAYTPELYLQKCEAVFAHIEKAYPERDLSIYGKDTGLNQSLSL
jgi:hypothetical protein